MGGMFAAINRMLGSLVALGFLTLFGAGGWVAYQGYFAKQFALDEAKELLARREVEIAAIGEKLAQREQEIVALNDDLQAKLREIERLETAMRLLKVDTRIARLEVLGQTGSKEKGDLSTQFSFAELDDRGEPLESPRVFKVAGDVVYVDAWVVKFQDPLVETGDPLRNASICLFRRVFGESQRPSEGFALDQPGEGPTPYRSKRKTSDFEREIWARFWDLANDVNLAGKSGIRAAHGEAPSIKLVPGRRYKVELRASGGLTITPDNGAAGEAT